MERTMSVEDKIRRAEEIYNRKKEKQYRATSARVSIENSTKGNDSINQKLKKIIIQIIVCMIIYLTFYYVINNNYIFSEDFKNKCEEILSYDISFSEMYKNIDATISWFKEQYKNIMQTTESDNLEQNEKQNVESNETNENSNQTEQGATENSEGMVDNQEQSQENSYENIGGADEVSNIENSRDENLTEEEQMKKDAEEIKAKINFIKPLQGTITSAFGWRNPTVSTVSKYHTGLDIAANEGTEIISATSGTVVLVSSEGAYGKHIKIENQGIIILYAHCSSLDVQEGQQINQGQHIAKVGSTGNSTGPHLHFEIRKDDRYVDPRLILDY